MPSLRCTLAGVTVLLLSVGCTKPTDFGYCSAEESSSPAQVSRDVTWHADIRPIVEGRCAQCHNPGGIGPFPLTGYEEVFNQRRAVRSAVVNRRMPPWLPADCCHDYQDDFSLDDEQIGLIDSWVERGAPEGDPADYNGSIEPIGGLSRTDVTVEMPEAYLPEPEPGRVDDFRCFVLDWPRDEDAFITGLKPVPGARSIVHHLLVAVASGNAANSVADVESEDGKPGFPCEGGFGDVEITSIVGGSLHGGDFPANLGNKIDGDSKIVLQVHYSMADAEAVEDKTALEFKLSDEAETASTIPIANPAWLMGDGMRIPAGAENKKYRYQFDPRLYTQGDPIRVWGATPHMHYFGTKLKIGIVRKDGSRECLLEIPRWDFGWEQPYWFDEPVRFEKGDELYLECQFSNTRAKQPIENGKREEPRDIAWGSENQDMCAGFVNFTKVEEE